MPTGEPFQFQLDWLSEAAGAFPLEEVVQPCRNKHLATERTIGNTGGKIDVGPEEVSPSRTGFPVWRPMRTRMISWPASAR